MWIIRLHKARFSLHVTPQHSTSFPFFFYWVSKMKNKTFKVKIQSYFHLKKTIQCYEEVNKTDHKFWTWQWNHILLPNQWDYTKVFQEYSSHLYGLIFPWLEYSLCISASFSVLQLNKEKSLSLPFLLMTLEDKSELGKFLSHLHLYHFISRKRWLSLLFWAT